MLIIVIFFATAMDNTGVFSLYSCTIVRVRYWSVSDTYQNVAARRFLLTVRDVKVGGTAPVPP